MRTFILNGDTTVVRFAAALDRHSFPISGAVLTQLLSSVRFSLAYYTSP